MKKFTKFVSIVSLYLCCNLVLADTAHVDFSSDELIIPCTQVINSDDPALNNQYFGAVLERTGDSTYELISAEPEDQAHCQRVGNFADFDNDSSSNAGTARVLVKCEKRSNRSKISVDGRDLPSDNYFATVTSGAGPVTSLTKPTTGDEVEFDFDSAADDVAAGATAISADFIQNGTVSAEIVSDSDGNVIASATDVLCAIRD